MVNNGNSTGPKLNENSLVNIIKLDLAKFDINAQNCVRDNQSEFIAAINVVLDDIRNLRVPCDTGDTVTFDFEVLGIPRFSTSTDKKPIIGADKNHVSCIASTRYFYMLDDEYDFRVKLVKDADFNKQFFDKLWKNLVSALPVKDVKLSSNYNVQVEFDFDTYIKRYAHDFSQLAIAYLAKFGIKAKAISTSKGVQIAMEAEDLLEKLSKK